MTRTEAAGTILVIVGLILIVGAAAMVAGAMTYLLWTVGGFVAASIFAALITGLALTAIGFELV